MKHTIISIIIALGIIVGFALLANRGDSNSTNDNNANNANNVSIVDGKQIIEITAKGGYFPRVSEAKAELPTVLKINTKGTFDCSSALVIPVLNYRKNLPQSGVTEIPVPPQKTGTSFTGLCSMGMYNFTLNFN